jgi:hypothetical protein
MSKTPRELLDAAARAHVPDDINLYPRIAAHLQRKTIMQTLRAKPALLILLVVIAFALLSGVAYAVGRSLGYIPGVGLVDQTAPLRVLAEPVSVTREGITLTVEQATLAFNKTVIVYTIEGVTWEMRSHQEDVPGCYASADIRLPDGSSLRPQTGSGGISAEGRWETRMTYSPVPKNVNEATFLLECIQDTLPGTAPENWEIPLRFVPASSDLNIAPVIDIPNGTDMPADGFMLDHVIETDDGYILVGRFKSASLPDNAQALGYSESPTVTDANGNELPYLTANDVDVVSTTMGEFPWTLEIKGKAHAWPLTIQLNALAAQNFDLSTDFTFDAGTNPQAGQEWFPAQDIQLGDFVIRLERVLFTGSGYVFEMSAPANVNQVDLQILDTVPLGWSGGGDGQGHLTASVEYDQPPVGMLTVHLSNPIFTVRDVWQLQWTPDNAIQSDSLYGIQLVLDRYIPIDDGYYLIGHLAWADERIQSVSEADMIRAFDVDGRELVFERARFSEAAGLMEDLTDANWVYRLYGKAFNGPITLRLEKANILFSPAAQYTLDLSSFGFEFDDVHLNKPYKTGLIPLEVPGLSADVFNVTYIKEGDLYGFEIKLDADQQLQGLTFTMQSGLDTTGMDAVSSAGGSYRDEGTGMLIARVLTDARMSFPLGLSAQDATIGGNWSVEWNPPAAAGSTPVYAAEACITLEKWKQAAASPEAIPSEIGQVVLVSRGALAPDPSLFLANLSGSADTPLVFGNGSLSPDGRQLVYSDEYDRLFILDISTREKTALGEGNAPLWSSDGKHIAFLRQTNQGFNVFVMDADGRDIRALTDTTANPLLSTWTPDSQNLIIALDEGVGYHFQLLNVSDARQTSLLRTEQAYDASMAISPDGMWMAYLDKVPGKMTPGIYVSRLDGLEKRLLMQLSHWMAFAPIFSPDGKWLAVNVMNTDLHDAPITPTLIELSSCKVVPLSGLKGSEIQEWGK